MSYRFLKRHSKRWSRLLLPALAMVLIVEFLFLSVGVYADYFSGQIGYSSISSLGTLNSDLIIGTSTTTNSYLSISMMTPIGNALNLKSIPSNTSMYLNWVPAPDSIRTVIRYRTDTYPTTPTDGTLAYNGTSWNCLVLGLTAGTVYYISAWGYNGVGYSSSDTHMVMATSAVALPSGGEETHPPVIPVPSVPATAGDPADITGFQLEPFTSIIKYFVTNNATSPGGLGMPENNAWEVLAIGVIVVCGMGVYTKMKNFFVAYFVVFFVTCIFVGFHIVQWYLPPIEMAIGAGVWALERYFQ